MSTPSSRLDRRRQRAEVCPTMVAYNGFLNDMMPTDRWRLPTTYLKRSSARIGRARRAAQTARRRLQLVNAVNAEFAPSWTSP